MKYYLAPLEGITTYVYRNAYHKHFHKMDKYFTPFIVPHIDKKFNTRELKELSPEHNEGLMVVPQLLTNNAEAFLKTGNDIHAMGYKEINLNLGCPSKTVVTKNKGSGFLAFPEELDRFLEEIFTKSTFKISVKTRLGRDSAEGFEKLLEIYNQYPIEELTVHPRIQSDYYNNSPNWDVFELAYEKSKNPVCYNGDIYSKETFEKFHLQFPTVDAVMLGRGVISKPGLVDCITSDKALSKAVLKAFHDDILEEYIQISSGERNVLFKMKELWFYMISLFDDAEKFAKKIKKAERLKDYNQIINTLFATCDLRKDSND